MQGADVAQAGENAPRGPVVEFVHAERFDRLPKRGAESGSPGSCDDLGAAGNPLDRPPLQSREAEAAALALTAATDWVIRAGTRVEHSGWA